MADAQETSAQAEAGTIEVSEFSALLEKEFRPQTDRARDAVTNAVRTLAEQALVIGEHRPAVAIAAQGLGREKGGAGDLPKAAGFGPAVFRPESLGGVFDHEQAVFFGEIADLGVIGRLPEEVDRDDPAHRQAFLA